jgi:hypothetical protein
MVPVRETIEVNVISLDKLPRQKTARFLMKQPTLFEHQSRLETAGFLTKQLTLFRHQHLHRLYE